MIFKTKNKYRTLLNLTKKVIEKPPNERVPEFEQLMAFLNDNFDYTTTTLEEFNQVVDNRVTPIFANTTSTKNLKLLSPGATACSIARELLKHHGTKGTGDFFKENPESATAAFFDRYGDIYVEAEKHRWAKERAIQHAEEKKKKRITYTIEQVEHNMAHGGVSRELIQQMKIAITQASAKKLMEGYTRGKQFAKNHYSNDKV